MTSYAYDAAGNLKEVQGPGATRAAVEYDPRGRVTRLAGPGVTEKRYSYWDKEAEYGVEVLGEGAGPAVYAWSKDGRRASYTDALGAATRTVLDARGFPAGSRLRFEYASIFKVRDGLIVSAKQLSGPGLLDETK